VTINLIENKWKSSIKNKLNHNIFNRVQYFTQFF